MEKLTIKELAPYLPYGLKGRVDKETYLQEENERIGELKTIDLADHNYELAVYGELGYFLCDISDFKPLIRPLSSLTEEMMARLSKEFDMPMIEHCLIEQNFTPEYIKTFRFEVVQKLIEWHFDVFGLIDRGLALPIEGKEVEGE